MARHGDGAAPPAEEADAPPAAPAEPDATRLTPPPRPASRLLGREAERAALTGLLGGASRLVTVTGPGGAGKTRLAVEVAAGIADAGRGVGVAFVDLSALESAELVLPAISRAAGLHPLADAASTRAQLVRALGGADVLLLLDNFEQVAGAAAEVAHLLAACAGLRALVTSRTPLGIAGEQEYPLAPLPLPAADAPGSLQRLAESPAVRLFVERARAARPGFALDAENASAVVEICRRVDGLPLALELAAARVRTLSAPALARRLASGMELLSGGRIDQPPRQRTLWAAIGWSYRLLGERGQRLFRALGVFAGGWSPEAAAAVVGLADARVDLAALASRSLVQAAPAGGEPRYAMLLTIREYAQALLRERGEDDELRRRHADYFLAFAEAAEPELQGANQAEWYDRVEREHENLRTAMRWAVETGDAGSALRLGAALRRFWWVRGYAGEGRELLLAALRLDASGTPPLVLARALSAAGVLGGELGDAAAAHEHFSAALAIQRAEGAEAAAGSTLANMGLNAARSGNPAAGRGYLEESLAIRRRLGHRWGLAVVLDHLGNLAWSEADYPRAARLFEESLAIARELGEEWLVANSLSNLGYVALSLGKVDAARRRFEESLELWRRLGYRRGAAILLTGFAGIAARSGDARRALRLAGAAAAQCEAIGAPLQNNERRAFEETRAAAWRALGEPAASEAWRAGRALSPEEALAEARSG